MERIKLPDCIFCKTNNWKYLQFGIDTKYFSCQTCFCVTPPKKTKQLAVNEVMKLKIQPNKITKRDI